MSTGRKGGRQPTLIKEIKELARAYGPEAIRTLARIMRDDTARPGERARAAETLLDRGFGRAPVTVTGEGGDGPLVVEVRDLRDAARIAAKPA